MTARDESDRCVPMVHGLSVDNAAAALRQAGLRPVAALKRFGSADSTARVEGSFPPSGAKLGPGARVELLPSLAISELMAFDGELPPPTTVPDVAGLDANTAVDALRAATFTTFYFQNHHDDTYLADLVSGTWPGAGSPIPIGSGAITVYISLGPFPPVEPPDSGPLEPIEPGPPEPVFL